MKSLFLSTVALLALAASAPAQCKNGSCAPAKNQLAPPVFQVRPAAPPVYGRVVIRERVRVGPMLGNGPIRRVLFPWKRGW